MWAVLWLVGLICCAEVGYRLYAISENAAGESQPYPRLPDHLTHHQLEPKGTVEFDPRNGTQSEAMTITLNSLGLRGPEPNLKKSSEGLRILCLGDEMTFGPQVSDENLFTAKFAAELQTILPFSVEVINAGVPEFCPLLSFLQYRHTLRSLQPDIVILTFDMSDVADDHAVRPFVELDDEGFPLLCANPELGAEQRVQSVQRHFESLRWAKCQIAKWKSAPGFEGFQDIAQPAGRYAWIRDDPPDWSIYIANALEPIAQLKTVCRQQGTMLLLSVVPAPWQISEQATPNAETRRQFGIGTDFRCTSRQPFLVLEEFASEHDLQYLDVSRVLEQVGNPEDLYLDDEPWLSERGHEVYSTILVSRLLPLLRSRLPVNTPPAGAPSTAAASRLESKQ